MTQPNMNVLGGVLQIKSSIISQIFFLKPDINFKRQFFYQTEC
jgi:hypothetical protein